MWKQLVRQVEALLLREPRSFIHEPVTHRLNPRPDLPQGMMSAIAPACEATLEQQKKSRSDGDLPGR